MRKKSEIPVQLNEDERIVYDVSSDVILFLTNPITEDEIKKCIRNLKSNK